MPGTLLPLAAAPPFQHSKRTPVGNTRGVSKYLSLNTQTNTCEVGAWTAPVGRLCRLPEWPSGCPSPPVNTTIRQVCGGDGKRQRELRVPQARGGTDQALALHVEYCIRSPHTVLVEVHHQCISSRCTSRWFVETSCCQKMAFALRFLIAMALLCGGSVPVMAFVDPLAIPAHRGGSASRTPLPPVQYRLRGGMQAFAAGEGGGDSIPERLAAGQAKIKHASQPNGARGMPGKAFTCPCECFLCACNCIDLVLV